MYISLTDSKVMHYFFMQESALSGDTMGGVSGDGGQDMHTIATAGGPVAALSLAIGPGSDASMPTN
jgi:hypothetical protein